MQECKFATRAYLLRMFVLIGEVFVVGVEELLGSLYRLQILGVGEHCR